MRSSKKETSILMNMMISKYTNEFGEEPSENKLIGMLLTVDKIEGKDNYEISFSGKDRLIKVKWL